MKPEYEREVALVIFKVPCALEELIHARFCVVTKLGWLRAAYDFFFAGLGFNVLAYS